MSPSLYFPTASSSLVNADVPGQPPNHQGPHEPACEELTDGLREGAVCGCAHRPLRREAGRECMDQSKGSGTHREPVASQQDDWPVSGPKRVPAPFLLLPVFSLALEWF